MAFIRDALPRVKLTLYQLTATSEHLPGEKGFPVPRKVLQGSCWSHRRSGAPRAPTTWLLSLRKLEKTAEGQTLVFSQCSLYT